MLKALLSEAGTDIKGHMRSRQELLEASGYTSRPKDFDDLLRILDSEIRLITPTDPEGESGGVSPRSGGERYYQLTHDYLVPSLRDCLTAKQKTTARGRAKLRLEERASAWSAVNAETCAPTMLRTVSMAADVFSVQYPQNRFLPAWWEYLRYLRLTTRRDRTETQQRMMKTAGRIHGWRLAIASPLLFGLLFGLNQYVNGQRRLRAESYVNAAINAPPDALPYAIRDVIKLPDYAGEVLQQRFGDGPVGIANDELTSMQQLHGLCALAALGQVRIDELIRHVTREPFHPPARRVRESGCSAGDIARGGLAGDQQTGGC